MTTATAPKKQKGSTTIPDAGTNGIEAKMIPLGDITPDPDQPRKKIGEEELESLAASIRTDGVITPISVRLNPGKGPTYMIISGERRWRASHLAEKTHIPAQVKNLTQEQITRAQLIENIQREDIEPMEEAAAIAKLMASNATPEDIAKQVGKTPYYVRQRAKLTNLIPKWVDIMNNFPNLLDVYNAIIVAGFEPKVQEIIYKEKYRKGMNWKIQFSNYDLQKFRTNLEDAIFNITDETLLPEMGACTTCSFNTAIQQLFSTTDKARCVKPDCFNKKTNLHIKMHVDKAIDNPEVQLVSMQHEDIGKLPEVIKATKAKREVWKMDSFHTVNPPRMPEFDADDYDDDEFPTEKEKRKEFERTEMGDYNVELQEYEQRIKSGDVKLGFIIAGHGKGKYLYVTQRKGKDKYEKDNRGSSAGDVKTSQLKPEDMTKSQKENEIERLKSLEKRNEVLDAGKRHVAIRRAMATDDNTIDAGLEAFTKIGHPMQKIDRGIMIFLLIRANSNIRFHDIKGIPKEPDTRNNYNLDYFKKLSDMDDNTLAYLIRNLCWDNFHNTNMINGIDSEDGTLYLIAEYLGVDIKAIDKSLAEKIAKRKQRVKERIAAINANKKVAPEKKKPGKAAAKKSKSKK